MKLLTLGKSNEFAKIDDQDWDRVNRYKWYLLKSNKGLTSYACRRWKEAGHYKCQLLHNFIIGLKGVDHINGDGLDCRRTNLRKANKSQNAGNAKAHRDNTSGFKGVYLDKRDNIWYSQVMKEGKTFSLGRFKEKEDAVNAYKHAHQKLFGEFSRT